MSAFPIRLPAKPTPQPRRARGRSEKLREVAQISSREVRQTSCRHREPRKRRGDPGDPRQPRFPWIAASAFGLLTISPCWELGKLQFLAPKPLKTNDGRRTGPRRRKVEGGAQSRTRGRTKMAPQTLENARFAAQNGRSAKRDARRRSKAAPAAGEPMTF